MHVQVQNFTLMLSVVFTANLTSLCIQEPALLKNQAAPLFQLPSMYVAIVLKSIQLTSLQLY